MTKTFLSVAFLFLGQLVFSQSYVFDPSYSEDGMVSTLLNSGGSFVSRGIISQPDGKMIISGTLPSFQKSTIKRFLVDGQEDTSFHFPITLARIKGLALQEDGKIVGITNNGLFRWHHNGDVDYSFLTVLDDLLEYDHYDVIVLPNGKIMTCGFKIQSDSDGICVARFNPDGSRDLSFGQGGTFKYRETAFDLVFSLKTLQDDKIMISGCSPTDSGALITLYRLLPNGTLDSTFGTNGVFREPQYGIGEGYDVIVQPDGKFLVTGYGFYNGKGTGVMIRYLPGGQPDLSFGVNGARIFPEYERIRCTIVRPDGKLLVLATDEILNRGVVFQLMPDGSADTTFADNGLFYTSAEGETGETYSMHLIGPEKILISSRRAPLSTPGLVFSQFVPGLSVGAFQAQGPFFGETVVYPNPVATDFTLKFSLLFPQNLSIDLFDVQGKRIKTLASQRKFDAGEHLEQFHLEPGMPAGNYFLRISIDGKTVSNTQIFKQAE